MKMSAHGELEINWHNDILICKPSGGVNLEGAIAFHKIIEQEIIGKKFKRFARIIHFADLESLGTQDAYKTITQHLKENKESGCVFIGLVSGNNICRFHFESAAIAAKLPYQYFDKLDEAIDYTKAYLNNS